MSYFFTADTHFGHTNIIKYCYRPFKTIEEMDAEIVRRWNSRVKEKDIVFHLGDFAFRDFDKYFDQLNGRIVWIKGNHDDLAWKSRDKFENYASGYYEAKIDGQTLVLCHYAMLIWNKSHFGSYHLYGHSHGTLPDNPNSLSMDVGVDTHNFYPYSYDEIKQLMAKKTFVPIDRHGEE